MERKARQRGRDRVGAEVDEDDRGHEPPQHLGGNPAPEGREEQDVRGRVAEAHHAEGRNGDGEPAGPEVGKDHPVADGALVSGAPDEDRQRDVEDPAEAEVGDERGEEDAPCERRGAQEAPERPGSGQRRSVHEVPRPCGILLAARRVHVAPGVDGRGRL